MAQISSSAPYFSLGSFNRPISTSNPDAQTWFTRGLVWCYAFNHEEAATCFQQTILYDPDCAIAYWGLAFCLGPNYNQPWAFLNEKELLLTVQKTHRAVEQAREKAVSASPVEKALIEALRFRYPTDRVPKEGECEAWNKAYAEAMLGVYKTFPRDLDVATLVVDALMNLTPWKLWDLRTGQPAEGARTLEAKMILDTALEQDGALHHPGLLHLLIHLMEQSAHPEDALPHACHLKSLVPDGGHLEHMPSHLEILCGDYNAAVTSNSSAIIADEKFAALRGPLNFYTLYRAHNYHFLIYAALFAGKSQIALQTMKRLEDAIPDKLLRTTSPTADWLEGFLSARIHVMVRFGLWDEIIALPLPEDQELYCTKTALMHYGKGIALASLGRVKEAEDQGVLFREAVGRVPESRKLFNNTCLDLLAVAAAMLEGETLYRKKEFSAAFASLRRAVHLDDNLPYDEPWGWMVPTRHALGALLLEQGHIAEAAGVYAADLGMDGEREPDAKVELPEARENGAELINERGNATLPRAQQHQRNVWALHGYYECLVKLGRVKEAMQIEPLLDKAKQEADVPIGSSCFCRRGVL